ncbi:MAG: Asp-tRNA(Asn)/Glu-tRNA(Gln) amidotransferase GatCAB subunit A [Rhodospirillaceae bacterium]|nr:Asp-tRNA(Asn)/Glu-tRNA(Gln) amidotransferase GatCAB subunit A [Rhodospirillaceae bacterium]|tara:strand:- start:8603 stop:10048 length:1446 start_codon:yes stop_codon:yes gene_type:complete
MLALTRRNFIVSSAYLTALFSSHRIFSQTSNLTDLTINDASALIRTGYISPVELTNAYLNRITDLNPQLNAFITVTEDQALDTAREMEEEISNGQWRGPLHGIPVALKDNIDMAGTLTTAASAVFANRTPSEDAEVVRRLKKAGAIILGKLNMHEFAAGGTSDVSYFGPVHNPWDTNRIPGGSSGGSAAAVAARLCAGALGTDTGGSIRSPAAYCGIVGLKPTYGLASIRGIIPYGLTADCVGPMTQNVADAAILMQILAGYDSEDIASIQTDIPRYTSTLTESVASLRLGIPRELYSDTDPQILSSTEEALDVLSTMTHSTQDVDLPQFSAIRPTLVESYAYHAEYLKTHRELYQPITLQRLLRGADISATDYAESRYELSRIRKSIDSIFNEVDLLIMPTKRVLPDFINENSNNPNPIRNTLPFNLYGTPAISVPCGFSREGLPIGLQISGPRLGETQVLGLAHAYEQVTQWHLRRPPL